MSLRSGLGAVRREVLCALYRRPVRLKNRGPLVSFTFDDFPRSACSAGGAILEEFGARGTYYAAPGLMNTSNDLGQHFCLDDLQSLAERGHELASHTYSHLSCRAVPGPAFREDVKKGRQALESLAGVDSGNFAYPFGHVTLQAKRALASDLGSARSIFPGFNGPEADLNLLRAYSLYGDVDRSEWAKQLIDENARRQSWLIFYTHDVRSSPSPYGCMASLLEAAVSAALRSGSQVLTIQAALAEAGVQNGQSKGQVLSGVSS